MKKQLRAVTRGVFGVGIIAILLGGLLSPTVKSAAFATTYIKEHPTPPLAGGAEKKGRIPSQYAIHEMAVVHPKSVVINGPYVKEVALTFDDGPDEVYTRRILDVLKKEGVHATFFLVGERAQRHPDIVQRIVREGHAIGGHFWNHANLLTLSPTELRRQVSQTDEVLQKEIHVPVTLVRPPYGEMNDQVIKVLEGLNKRVVFWSVDSLDWKSLTRSQLAANVMGHVTRGAIILEHAAGDRNESFNATIESLPTIITELRRDGFSFVTVPDLLRQRIGARSAAGDKK